VTLDQALPFQCRMRVSSTSDEVKLVPTAQALVAEVAVTPSRKLPSAVATGLDTLDQLFAVPVQDQRVTGVESPGSRSGRACLLSPCGWRRQAGVTCRTAGRIAGHPRQA